ncbi:hypothetical protein AQB9606_03142 [Aquabacterium sp. CECT 9606]|nr:hypothetical protein AQB9606_03142 [Aquabacterium sp. CECT 9606]
MRPKLHCLPLVSRPSTLTRRGSMCFARLGSSLAIVISVARIANATENFDVRYAPGLGGADMSAPVDPGWYFQAPSYAYDGKISLSLTDDVDLTDFGAPGAIATVPTQSQVRVKVGGIAPRLTFMSTTQWLGATLGATAQLPLVEKKAGVSVLVGSATFNTPLGQAAEDQIASGIGASIRQQAAALTSSRFGVGDLEIAPILRWARDPEQILLAMFLSLPTGEYNKNRTANPGAGNFYTVRPLGMV